MSMCSGTSVGFMRETGILILKENKETPPLGFPNFLKTMGIRFFLLSTCLAESCCRGLCLSAVFKIGLVPRSRVLRLVV